MKPIPLNLFADAVKTAKDILSLHEREMDRMNKIIQLKEHIIQLNEKIISAKDVQISFLQAQLRIKENQNNYGK